MNWREAVAAQARARAKQGGGELPKAARTMQGTADVAVSGIAKLPL